MCFPGSVFLYPNKGDGICQLLIDPVWISKDCFEHKNNISAGCFPASFSSLPSGTWALFYLIKFKYYVCIYQNRLLLILSLADFYTLFTSCFSSSIFTLVYQNWSMVTNKTCLERLPEKFHPITSSEDVQLKIVLVWSSAMLYTFLGSLSTRQNNQPWAFHQIFICVNIILFWHRTLRSDVHNGATPKIHWELWFSTVLVYF